MGETNRHRRVAAALTAATLAGGCTAWLTGPSATAQDLEPPPSTAATDSAPPPTHEASTRSGHGSTPSSDAGPAGSPRSAGTGLLGRPAAPTPQQSRAPAPTSLSIQRLGIRMDIRPEGVSNDGGMAIAPDPADLGWYRYGPRPGDEAGATVLAAHVDSHVYGIGPLARLVELHRGDVITVQSGSQTHRYSVQSVTATKKTAVDLDALFTRQGPPRLHVVTCGGTFDRQRGHYDKNIVVVATPMR